MRIRFHHRALLVTLLGLYAILPMPALAQCRSVIAAGVVVDFSGPSRGYELIRAGRPARLGFYTQLQHGDRLRVLVPGGYVTLNQGVRDVTVRAADGLLCIRGRASANWLTNALTMLGSMLSVRRDQGTSSLVTRTDESLVLGPRDLLRGEALIADGDRHIAFAWLGGTPPFRVIVSRDGTNVIDEPGLAARVLRLRNPRPLSAGRYSVLITDANNQQAAGTFTAVASLPTPEASTPTEAMSRAAVLLGDERRRYEAFILLSPHRAASPSVRELSDLLVEQE